MADKSLLSRIFTRGSTDLEIKALQDRLDIVAGEAYDKETYDSKFIEAEASTFQGNYMANFSGIDQVVDIAALQRVYASETWVYSAVSAIADAISPLPIVLQKRVEYKKEKYNDLLGKNETVNCEIWENVIDSKLSKLFQHPNPYASKSEFISLISIDLLTAGDYYIYLDSDQDLSALSEQLANGEGVDDTSPWGRLRTMMAMNANIKGMYRIPPAMIKPVKDDEKNCIAGYVLQTDRGNFAFAAAEVIHVRLPNPNDQFMGLSPLIPAFKPVLLDRFSTEHMIRFYKSGARLGGIITTDKALNKEQLGRFQRTFESNYTGRQNHHRTLILPPGMKYEKVEQNPAETALLEFCKYNREAILAVYRVPPIKLGIMDNANYANARVQLKLFFTQTIKKYLGFIEDGFNNHPAILLDNRMYRVQFDLSNVEELQEDLNEKAKAGSEMMKAGATVNEVREVVWKRGPIEGGNKSLAVAEIDAKERIGAAPVATTAPVEPLKSTNQVIPTALNGPQVSAMMEIVKQVGSKELTRNSGIEMIVAAFNITREAAEKIMGDVGNVVASKEAMPNVQLDTAALSDITPTIATFSDRVAQLVHAFVQGGVPMHVAIPKAIEQARQEGFKDQEGETPKPDEGKDLGVESGETGSNWVPTNIGGNCPKCDKPMKDCKCDGDKSGKAPTLAEYISSEIAKLSDDSEITPETISALKQKYKELYEGAAVVKEIQYANGHTKDSVIAHWKGFIDKTDPLVEKRYTEVKHFFDKYKSLVMNRFGANIKSFGAFKSRDSEDTDQILDPDAYKKLIKEYISKIDDTLTTAMEAGFADTLANFNFGETTDASKVALEEYALKSITSIDETTRDQLKTLLNDMFAAGKSVTEIGTAIRDKFSEIEDGRAMTIARTETLTAVSIGKADKRDEFEKRFPETKLMKMWVTAKDDRVRDSHADLEGVSVEANDTFPNGLLYPRDPDGEAGEVINCRCDVIDYAEEDQSLIESFNNDLGTEEEQKHFCALGIHEKGGAGSGCHGDNCGRKPTDGSKPSDERITVSEGNPVRIGEGGQSSKPPTVSEGKPRPIKEIKEDLQNARDALREAQDTLKQKPDDQNARNAVGHARARVREIEREGRAAIAHARRNKPKQ